MIELLLQAERALSMGMVDQADRLYRQAVEADPRNSIAVVGLARVALERDDDALAWREGKRALAIDPENAAARRLVDRLEEVWRYRGLEPPAAEEPAPAALPSELSVPESSQPAEPSEPIMPSVREPSVPPVPEPSMLPPIAPVRSAPSEPPPIAPSESAPDPVLSGRSIDVEPRASTTRAAPPAPAAVPAHRRSVIDRLLRRDRP